MRAGREANGNGRSEGFPRPLVSGLRDAAARCADEYLSRGRAVSLAWAGGKGGLRLGESAAGLLEGHGQGARGASGGKRAEGSRVWPRMWVEREAWAGTGAGGVAAGRAGEGVDEGKRFCWFGSPLGGRVEKPLAFGRRPEAVGRERSFSLGGRLAGQAVAGRERFACSCCWQVGRWAAQPAHQADRASRSPAARARAAVVTPFGSDLWYNEDRR